MDLVIEQAVSVMLVLSLVPLVAIALAGGVVSLLQAMLQVQEQSILHLVRLGVLAAAMFLGGGAAFGEIEGLFVAVVSACAHLSGDGR